MLGRQDRANWQQRRTLYCNWGDILEILHRGNTVETTAEIQREVMTCRECREKLSEDRIRPPKRLIIIQLYLDTRLKRPHAINNQAFKRKLK